MPGTPKYNYVALARSTDPTSFSKIADLRVTSGDSLFQLQAGRSLGDWGAVPIYFDAPFLAPPILLMTAQSRAVQGTSDLRAFHGIANHVDQHGFTISVRNADFEAGTMMLNWIALGCGKRAAAEHRNSSVNRVRLSRFSRIQKLSQQSENLSH